MVGSAVVHRSSSPMDVDDEGVCNSNLNVNVDFEESVAIGRPFDM